MLAPVTKYSDGCGRHQWLTAFNLYSLRLEIFLISFLCKGRIILRRIYNHLPPFHLKKWPGFTRQPLTLVLQHGLSRTVLALILTLTLPTATYAQEDDGWRVLVQTDFRQSKQAYSNSEQETYSYREAHEKKTLSLMLYGFQTDAPPLPQQGASIMKDKKALSGFFKKHWENVKRDYLGQDGDQLLRLSAGDDSFTSASVNRATNLPAAKLVGATVPVGKFTVGGGYTWDEENPALMLPSTSGLMAGVSFDDGNTGYQLSYLASGQEFMGFEIGKSAYRYESLMFSTSFRVTDKIGLTATAQYRHDADPITDGDQQMVFTIGTKWKF